MLYVDFDNLHVSIQFYLPFEFGKLLMFHLDIQFCISMTNVFFNGFNVVILNLEMTHLAGLNLGV